MKKEEALNILETFLTDEQLARLKGVSEMTGAPISTLIQIAVADYLKNLPKSLSQGRNRLSTTDVVAHNQLPNVAVEKPPLSKKLRIRADYKIYCIYFR